MSLPAETITLPLSWLLLFFALFASLLALAARSFLSTPQPSASTPGPYSGLAALDHTADTRSLFHTWDPRLKVLSLLLYCFFVVSLSSLLFASAAVLIALAAVIIAGIPAQAVLRRMTAMAGFLGMFLVVMPLTVPVQEGDTLIRFTHLPFFTFNVRGILTALAIITKAAAISLMMGPLVNTSPFPITVRALSSLGVSQKICQMLLLTHRYIYVFQHEINRMQTAMRARGFMMRSNLSTIRTIGNFLGMLFVRSFERTERVYDAMLCRGFTGAFPSHESFHARGKDWIISASWLILGAVLFILDRYWYTG